MGNLLYSIDNILDERNYISSKNKWSLYTVDYEIISKDLNRIIVLATYLSSDFKEYKSDYDKRKKGVGSLKLMTSFNDEPEPLLRCRNTYRSIKSILQYHYLGHLEDIDFREVTADTIVESIEWNILIVEDPEKHYYLGFSRSILATMMFNYQVRGYDKEYLYNRILRIKKYPEVINILVSRLNKYKNWKIDLMYDEFYEFMYRGLIPAFNESKKNKED